MDPVDAAQPQQMPGLAGAWQTWFNTLYQRLFIIRLNLRSVTGSTQITENDATVIAVIAAPATFTLPDARRIKGQVFLLKNDATSVAVVTMASTSAQTIDNAAAGTFTIAAGAVLRLQSDGANWIVL